MTRNLWRSAGLPVFMLVLFTLSFSGSVWGQVVINEIDYDQPGIDTAEFVELKNVGSTAVDLSQFRLDLVNGASGGAAVYGSFSLPAVMLPAGGYYVICGNAANVANCDLDVTPDQDRIQNGAPDAVALYQNMVLVDTVSYEGNTLAPFTEGSGVGLEDSGATGQDLKGISRLPDGTDTNQNNVDFSFVCITPGATNTAQNTDCQTLGQARLVINEIDYDQPGTDASEFLELYNGGNAPANLGDYTLELVNGNGGGASIYNTIALPATMLGPGEYFVICANSANTVNCDLDVTPDTNLIQNGAPDAVGLRRNGTLVDAVSYEGNSGAPYTEGSGVGLEDSGGAAFVGISRFPDGTDTDQNNVDLISACITPGSANTSMSTGCQDPGALPMVVINEIDYDQPGTDTAEFVELKNVGGAAADLSQFSIELVNGNGGGAAIYQTIALPAVMLAPGDYFVVCGNAATVFNCDLDVSPDTNLIQNGAPDAVGLRFGALLVDAVSYEGDTGAPYTEGSGSGLEDPSAGGVGGPDEFKGISRFPDGADTNQNNVDLSTRCITPGAPNAFESSNCPQPGPPGLVINEIDYDQPGADFAEFVEIKNVSGAAVDLGSISLQLINGFDTSVYATIPLPAVSLASGDYFVVCGNTGSVPNCDLPVASFSIQNGSPDAVALVSGGIIVDTVSYEGDTGAPYTEGSGAGLEDSGAGGEDFKGISRFPDGVDTDQNNVDFGFVCVTPGGPNTSLSSNCSQTGPVLEIYEIQANSFSSPYAGQTIRTIDNVVTAVGTDGFAMQTPTARTDADVNTSDGIFVFTGGAPGVSVGDLVDVVGTVQEFFNFTEYSLPAVSVVGSGALPAPVVFDATVPSPDPTAPSCSLEFECYEGMLVSIADGTVTGPNQRFGTDPIAEVHITAAPVRTFREKGIQFPGIMGLPVWDGNPEVFELDPNRLGLPNQIIPAGSSFSATGVIGFEFGGYELWPTQLSVTPAPLPVPVRPRAAGEFTVGSLNLFRLFDDVNDGNGTVVSAAEYARRLEKFSRYIREVLDSPDILAVEEAEKVGVLDALAARIASDDPGVVYTAYLIEGNDVGGIDVGFLVRDTVQVNAVTQLGATEILSVDGSLLHDRPPLLLDADYIGNGAPFAVAVMAVHNRSLNGIDDPMDGPRVRQKRFEQAQSIATFIQNIQTANPAVRLAVTGDFNAFEFTDSYVDAVGQIRGVFDPAENLISGPDLVDPDLTNQVLNLPASQRYSFVFAGSAQTLDHMLTSQELDFWVRDFAFGRGNSDAAVDLINDASTALRSSDHDGPVLYVMSDSDADGIPDDQDLCAGTSIPEGVPTEGLGVNRWALVDGDGIFDTTPPSGGGSGPGYFFTIEDTRGCSCEQIIVNLGLGEGHRKHGCSNGAMLNWVDLVNP